MSCGALSSTILVPELQYWVNRTIVNGSLNKYGIPAAVELNSIVLPHRSFIELLFNDSYSHTSYLYHYVDISNSNSWPGVIRDRMMIYAASAKYYWLYTPECGRPDSTAKINLFLLEPDDLTMLDALLAYRMDETGVTLIDSTSTSVVDTTSGTIISVNYNGLSTDLSKLIYHYLNLKINNDFSSYDNTNLISDSSSLLASCYEAYVIEQMFQFMSDRGT